MTTLIVVDTSMRLRLNFKPYPFVALEKDEVGAFSKVLMDSVHTKDIRAYIHAPLA